MENIRESKKTSINLGCLNWPSFILSIALIAIRAFQPGAQPIESWSASSWTLMLLPVIIVVGLQALACLLMVFACVMYSASDSHI